MNWSWIASGSIVVMLAYFIVDNHVDLYPWNNLVTSQLPSTLAGVIPFGLYAVAFAAARDALANSAACPKEFEN